MSFWIHAYCHDSVEAVTPEELRAGIADRLRLLTSLFCLEHEEDPDEVLARLRIEVPVPSYDTMVQAIELFLSLPDHRFDSFLLHYHRSRSDTDFIRMDRYDRAGLDEHIEEIFPVLPAKAWAELRPLFDKVTDDVAFCLKTTDVDSMGFPLAIAAAAYLVERAGGVIQSGSYSWMVPDDGEVRIIHAIDL